MSRGSGGASASTMVEDEGGGALSKPASSAPASFPRLDKYELLEEIGHGGMATVYRARDRRLGREVAVKLIHRHLRENTEVGTRFVAEARAAAKLRHPGIVDVFDVSDTADPERYLVVELIRGTTLRKVLLAHRDMPAEVGASIVIQLCDALDHAHASAIIHRDVKPENVLVELPEDRACNDGGAAPKPSAPRDATATPRPSSGGRSGGDDTAGVVIKITDFGIAKVLDAQGVTSTGQVLGSPAHMAPEQIEGGEVDPRTDVFALGVLMYECLVGHLPFEGKNPAQVLRRVLDGTYPAADRERATVGGRWARVLAGALAHDPAQRTASAAALREQIRAELEALGISDPRAEISAYFADPAGYPAALCARRVPRLAARGEAARKAGDVWGAAADWNRALALAPDDLAILRRIGSLSSTAQRALLVRRLAAILAGSVVLGVSAFGVARALKGREAGAARPGAASGTALAGPVPPPIDTAPTAGARDPQAPPTGPVTSRPAPVDPPPIARIPATPTIIQLAPPPSGTREVKFNVQPKGARLYVDGVDVGAWLNRSFQLTLGAHAVEAVPTDPHCCKKVSNNVTVLPEPPQQTFSLQMELNPATVTLAGNAPPGARVQCIDAGLTLSAGGSVTVKLRSGEMTVDCMFTAPDRPLRRGSVKLEAGKPKTIAWPD
jgi:serine/threonine protein kinase